MRRPSLTQLLSAPLWLCVGLVVGCASDQGLASVRPAETAVSIASAPGEALAFEPSTVSVDVAGPVAITFLNASSLPHNLTFTGTLSAGTRTIVSPGTSDELNVEVPAAGSYTFVCTIHEGMSGTLVVEGAAAR